jgi:ABC-2 type transport system permease protein
MIAVLRTVGRRRVIEFMRYPFDLVTGMCVFYVIFLAIFYGDRSFGSAEARSGSGVSALVIGFVVFVLTQQTFQGFGSQLINESAAGTLEQLAMNRYGLVSVLLADFSAQAAVNTVVIGLVIVPMMATTGQWLHFDALTVIPLMLLTMGSVVGLGLAVGGCALVFKRINGLAGVLQFGFIFLVAAPVDRFPLLKLLPIANANFILREALIRGRSLYDHPISELCLLVGVVIGWLVVGLVVFSIMESKARQRALLGQY